MRITAKVMTVLVLALGFGSFGIATAKPAGQGAFLVEYADTVPQLISQVENNRLVALRYAKHFRTDPSTVLTAFRNELSVGKLDETVTLQVYFLDESRNIVSEQREFKAGTKVFMNKSGRPLLECGTGNPLAASLSGAQPRSLADTMNSEKPAGRPDESKEVKVQVLEQPPTELPATPSTADARTLGTTPAAADAGVPAINNAGLPGTVASGTPSGRPSIGASASRLLIPLGVAGLAVALGGGGGGGVSSVTPPPNNGGGGNEPPPVPEPTPIPEPTSVMTLAAGVLALSGGLFWRRLYGRKTK